MSYSSISNYKSLTPPSALSKKVLAGGISGFQAAFVNKKRGHFMSRGKIVDAIMLLALFAIILLLFNSPVYAEIYKWVDKDGSPHFSDMPPTEAQTDYKKIKAESGSSFRKPSGETGYLATATDGKEYLWRDYTDEGDKYCVPTEGGRLCILKNKITSIRKITGRPKKDFDRPPFSAIVKGSADRTRSADEEALDDDEEQYPENTDGLPVPPNDNFSLAGAGEICRYAILNMSIPVSTDNGSRTYYVKTAKRTSILPYKDDYGRQGHRFCFSVRGVAPEVKIGLARSVLCSIYRVGDKWQYELKQECSFTQ